MKNLFSRFFFVSVFSFVTALSAAESELRIYQKLPLYGLEFSRLKEYAPAILSKQGKLTHLPEEECVLVYDTQEVISECKVMINRLRLKMFNVRILVDYIREDPVGESRIVFGVPTLPDAMVNSSPPGAPDLGVDFFSVHYTNSGTKWMLTADGQPIAIWLGKYAGNPAWLAKQELVPEKNMTLFGSVKKMPSVSGKAFSRIRWSTKQDASAIMILPIVEEPGESLTLIIYPRIQYYDADERIMRSWAVISMATSVKLLRCQRFKAGNFFFEKQQDFLQLFGQKFFRLSSDRPMSEIHVSCFPLRMKDTSRDPRSPLSHK